MSYSKRRCMVNHYFSIGVKIRWALRSTDLKIWCKIWTDMPTSGNTNLYFEAHKPVFFNKNLYFLKTYTNRLPLPHFITRIFITSIAWFTPFLDGFMKSQLREYSSLKVCFLLFLDAITLINCIKYPDKICF